MLGSKGLGASAEKRSLEYLLWGVIKRGQRDALHMEINSRNSYSHQARMGVVNSGSVFPDFWESKRNVWVCEWHREAIPVPHRSWSCIYTLNWHRREFRDTSDLLCLSAVTSRQEWFFKSLHFLTPNKQYYRLLSHNSPSSMLVNPISVMCTVTDLEFKRN